MNSAKHYFFFGLLFFIGFSSYAQVALLDSLQKVLATSKEDTNKVKLIFKIADITFKELDKPDTFLVSLVSQAIPICKEVNYSRGLTKAYLKIATYYKTVGKFSLQNYFLDKALESTKSTNNALDLFDIYNAKGGYFFGLANFSQAAEYYFKALKIAEELKDKTKISSAYNGLGNVFVNQDDCKKSIF